MLNHCFSLLNYFKLGISFFKEIRVVNSHIRYCLIFKFLFSHLSLSFESLSVTALLLYHVVFCLSSTFSKFFEVFLRSETLLKNFPWKRKLNIYNLSRFCCRLADSLIIIPPSQAFVNTFFSIRKNVYFFHHMKENYGKFFCRRNCWKNIGKLADKLQRYLNSIDI